MSMLSSNSSYSNKSGILPWVDPSTPDSAQSLETTTYGQHWKKTDGVNSALEVYSTNMTGMECDDDNNCYFYINTTDESIAKTVWSDYISPPGFEAVYFYYRSGMVQSWNKFCFQGGMIEVRAQLPGAVTNESGNPGVSTGSTTVRAANIDYYPTWPGIWLMGNLGRAIFSASTSRMWPFTYIECNETTFDSQNQRISACNDTPGYDCTTEGANQADVPTAYYFNLQDDIQAFAMVNASIAEGITDKACTMETCPGSYDPSADLGYMNTALVTQQPSAPPLLDRLVLRQNSLTRILWEIEGQPIFEVTADVLTNPPQNSAQMNPKKIMIEEPMYIIFNVALSTNNAICDSFPMYLKIDYVRLYQDTSDNTDMAIGCDPDTHPTKQFIKDNIDDYIDDDNPDTAVSGMAFCDSNTDCTISTTGTVT
ncbi:hypothetical protein JG688_00004599 [Phytophthora aleatoria]|uniref:GH16 domain-containing protein n=1 Tax=Phytophthora aleatoria TaxID=2496075 RepID=A0A8J5J1R7_9STRA|nr:hypothetical protein JG688_00004599 [Phytophthora aleatoria]